ncbi:MAG: amino acid permease [Planctomycetes bacterium]|nr:amino acid permease [Planctomycetota bacterium]
MLIVVVIYLVANWAYLRLLGPAGVATSETLAADAVNRGWAGAGTRLVAGAVALSAFGVLNANMLTGPRLIQGLAADGRFFRVLATIAPNRRTPIPAIALLAVMSLLLLLAAAIYGAQRPIDLLLTGVVFVDCVFFAMTGAAVIILRKRRADAPRPVRVPLYPLVPILFVLGELAILAGAYMDPGTRGASYIGLAWLVAAGLLWLPYRPRRTA